METSLLMTASFSSRHCAPGKTRASHPTGLLSPLSRSRVWPIVSFQAHAPGSPHRLWAWKKDIQMGGNRGVFCFLLQEKAKLFLAPFSTNQIFFPFLKALCLAGFRQGSGN